MKLKDIKIGQWYRYRSDERQACNCWFKIVGINNNSWNIEARQLSPIRRDQIHNGNNCQGDCVLNYREIEQNKIRELTEEEEIILLVKEVL
jgi:hypothetical protein